MRFYLNTSGQPEGPFDEGQIVEWIRTGALRNGAVCQEGGQVWMGLGQHPVFAEALYGPVSDESEARPLGGTLKIDDIDPGGHPSTIPPPPSSGSNDLVPALGTRTPSKPMPGVNFEGELPANAPAWMHHAQRMIAGLRQALAQGNIPAATEAGIERAYAGWELDGSTERQIARLTLLLEQTHTIVRNAAPETLTQTVSECAQIVRRGVPKHARQRIDLDALSEVIRDFRDRPDPWAAVVDATAELLGWRKAAVAHVAHLVRLSIEEYRKPRD